MGKGMPAGEVKWEGIRVESWERGYEEVVVGTRLCGDSHGTVLRRKGSLRPTAARPATTRSQRTRFQAPLGTAPGTDRVVGTW